MPRPTLEDERDAGPILEEEEEVEISRDQEIVASIAPDSEETMVDEGYNYFYKGDPNEEKDTKLIEKFKFAEGFVMNVTYFEVMSFLEEFEYTDPSKYKRIYQDAMSHYEFEMDYLKAIDSEMSDDFENSKNLTIREEMAIMEQMDEKEVILRYYDLLDDK